MAAACGLYAARTDQFCGWVIFDDDTWDFLGIIRDVDILDAADQDAFIHARLARWANDMGSLYALLEEKR